HMDAQVPGHDEAQLQAHNATQVQSEGCPQMYDWLEEDLQAQEKRDLQAVKRVGIRKLFEGELA
ncbi:MAG: hypothetical protein AAF346_19310, partial [Pseudomonadota bacterium]